MSKPYRSFDGRRTPSCDKCQDTGTIWGENVFEEALAPRKCEDQACRLNRS